jgi:hypothetical protein
MLLQEQIHAINSLGRIEASKLVRSVTDAGNSFRPVIETAMLVVIRM